MPCKHRVVTALQRIDGQCPEPRPVEDHLDGDGARYDVPEVDRDQRDRRKHRVRERVAPQDPGIGDAFGAGGRDVFIGHRLDDRGPHQDRVLPDEPERDGRHRQDKVRRAHRRCTRSASRAGSRGSSCRTTGTNAGSTRRRAAGSCRAGSTASSRGSARLHCRRGQPGHHAAIRRTRQGETDDDRDDLPEAEQQQRRPDAASDDLGHRPSLLGRTSSRGRRWTSPRCRR